MRMGSVIGFITSEIRYLFLALDLMASVATSVFSGIADTVTLSLERIAGGVNMDYGEKLSSVFIPDQKENIPQSSEHRVDDVSMEVSEELSSIFIPDEKKERYPYITQENWNQVVKDEDVDFGEKFCSIFIPEEKKEECDMDIPQDSQTLKPDRDIPVYIDMEVSDYNSQDAETLKSNFAIYIDQEMPEENSRSQDAVPPKSDFSVYIDIDEPEDNASSQVGGGVIDDKTGPSPFEIHEDVKDEALDDIPMDQNDEKNETQTANEEKQTSKRILDDIQVEFATILACWTPFESVSPDFIATIMGRHNVGSIRNNWSSASIGSTSELFSGLIADFRDEESVKNAARELFLLSDAVHTIRLNLLLELFSRAEASVGTGSTSIVVSGKSLVSSEEEAQDYIKLLKTLGSLSSVTFYPTKHGIMGPICRATYLYTTQAYAAKFYLDGLHYHRPGHFRVDVQEGYRERKIFQEVKSCMEDFMDEAA